jgi:uncharacterized protein (DUF1330 family)
MARAYTISDVSLRDRGALDQYRTLAAASIAHFGGAIWFGAARWRRSRAIGGRP